MIPEENSFLRIQFTLCFISIQIHAFQFPLGKVWLNWLNSDTYEIRG